MSFKVLELYTDKEVTQGPERGSVRRYAAHPSSDGFPVYKRIPGPRRSDDIELHVSSLTELWTYLSAGHKTRFSCADGTTSAPVVLGIDENDFQLKVSKS